MAKTSKKKTPFVKKEKGDLSVGFGKYKDKTLKWVAENDEKFFREIKKLYFKKYDEKKQEHYNKIFNLTFNPGVKVNDEQFQNKVGEIVGLLREKKTNEEITAYLKKDPNYSFFMGKEILSHAKALIRKDFAIEKDHLLDIHLIRYEEIFDTNLTMDLSHIQPGYRNAIKCENYLTAMESLFQKEKLLGIHTKSFKEKMSTMSFRKDDSKLDFDILRLNFQEQLELASLLEKAKSTDKIVRDIVMDTNPLQVGGEIVAAVTHVDEAPITKSKQTDVVGEEQAKQGKQMGKTFVEVQQDMAASLKEKVKELYDKKFKK